MALSLATSLQGFTQSGLAAFNTAIHQLVDKQQVAHIVTLVARHGQVVNIDAYGVMDVTAMPVVPIKNDSIYRLASMTKPLVGASMMMLFEEGKWALEDPVSKFIPEFKDLKVKEKDGSLVPQNTPMLMKQIMSHSAGFGRGMPKGMSGNLQDMINGLAKEPLAFQPGKNWIYGPSVDIQGYIVEKLSGKDLSDFMQERLLKPMGMLDTGFWVDPAKASRVPRIHRSVNGKLVPQGDAKSFATAKPKLLSGGGGCYSTVSDYYKFTQMILNGGEYNGKRYLKPETVKIMHTNVLEPGVASLAGNQFGMDFAIVHDPVAAKTKMGIQSFEWHGAHGTFFWIDPVNDLSVVGFIQSQGPRTFDGGPAEREVAAEWIYKALEKNVTKI
jgi:CubicO group peptidase (beta-lactamase class C family)